MTTLREAAQQALEALDWHSRHGANWSGIDEATEALRAALATGDNLSPTEPVAWLRKNGFRFLEAIEPQDDSELPLYTAPPQRKPLTEEEIDKAYREICRDLPIDFDHTPAGWIEQGIRYAERAHGIGGEA